MGEHNSLLKLASTQTNYPFARSAEILSSNGAFPQRSWNKTK